MVRLALFVVAAGGMTLTGCAGTWDKISSRKFREAPFDGMFSSEDPMTVLRTKVEGNERADAMRRLEEPVHNGGTEQEQGEALQILATAATSDPSPVVRTAAIDALGRFRDPRAVKILIAAYHRANGLPVDEGDAEGSLRQADGRFTQAEALASLGPVGFEPSFVTALRSRSAAALAQTNHPDAVAFLSNVAAGGAETTDRDVRSAAVRGLGQMRSPEAVTALARVLKEEAGRDVVLAQNAHDGLKSLTGQDLPADPDQWNQVIQAGVEVQPEQNLVQRAVGWVTK